MKNSKKLIALTTALLAIGSLAACGGSKGGDSKAPSGSSKCSHKWVVDEEKSVAATCTTEGKKVQKCSVCGEVKESKVSKKAHSYVEQAGGTAATCEAAGTKISKCSVCEDVKTEEVPALGHDYVDDAEQPNAATCTAAGETVQHCSRCQAEKKVAVDPLGHDYADDEDQTGAKQPTCDKAGEKFQTCTRCGDKHSEPVDALGHDVQLIGDDTEPEPGKAKVRVYTCANGCGETYLGFKANEPSEESKSHLVIGEDGGARFWGRPIGNDLELDEDGTSVNQQTGELVFNENQTGDFFEYKFDLTKEQADSLSNCYLYCDAKPAGWLSGQDFWAYGANSGDWTPGAYIEGERKGEIIDDYRYVLYVDGVRKDFDDTIKNPVTGQSGEEPRGEFILPYRFSLHEGENSIRLVMAGGYRSTFYNFTFRAAPVDPWRDPEADHSAEAYKATFLGLEHVKLYEYYNNDYKADDTMPCRESKVNYLWSRSKEGADNGLFVKDQLDEDGKRVAQWNFRLVPDAGYVVESITPDAANYKGLKTGKNIGDKAPDDAYGVTQVKGDVTFTVVVKAAA